MHCEEQDALRETAMAILRRIDELTQEQIQAMRDRNDERLMALDKQLETAFGEKERAFGVLLHHRETHGC